MLLCMTERARWHCQNWQETVRNWPTSCSFSLTRLPFFSSSLLFSWVSSALWAMRLFSSSVNRLICYTKTMTDIKLHHQTTPSDSQSLYSDALCIVSSLCKIQVCSYESDKTSTSIESKCLFGTTHTDGQKERWEHMVGQIDKGKQTDRQAADRHDDRQTCRQAGRQTVGCIDRSTISVSGSQSPTWLFNWCSLYLGW